MTNKEYKYLWILDYSYGGVLVIKLTDKDLDESERYYDFEEYMRECIAPKYEFRMNDVEWMTTDVYNVEKHGF